MEINERKIFLLRHPATMLCGHKRLVGQLDVPLGENGMQECMEIAQYLSRYPIKKVFSSNLRRTVTLANEVADYLQVPVAYLAGLNEISLGDWDGLYVSAIKRDHSEEYEERGRDILSYRIPNGENFYDLQKRAVEAFQSIIETPGDLAIVAHASVNKVLLSYILGAELDNVFKINQEHSCLNVIKQRGDQFAVELINGRILKPVKRKADRQQMGARINSARKIRGFKQNQLAKMLGISNVYLSEIERGVKAPSWDVFVKIVERLDVSSDYLLFGIGEAVQGSAIF